MSVIDASFPFIRYVLSTYSGPGTVLGNDILPTRSLHLVGRQMRNKKVMRSAVVPTILLVVHLSPCVCEVQSRWYMFWGCHGVTYIRWMNEPCRSLAEVGIQHFMENWDELHIKTVLNPLGGSSHWDCELSQYYYFFKKQKRFFLFFF